MKKINQLDPEPCCHGFREKELKALGIEWFNSILSRHPEIKPEYIQEVGILENGKFQFKVSSFIRDRQIICALALLKHIFDLKDEEINAKTSE